MNARVLINGHIINLDFVARVSPYDEFHPYGSRHYCIQFYKSVDPKEQPLGLWFKNKEERDETFNKLTEYSETALPKPPKKIIYMEKEETNLESAEKFLRSKYKLIDFHMLHINGHPWLELMEEYHRLKSAHPSRQIEVELPSDEEIEKIFPTDAFNSGEDDNAEELNMVNGHRQDGAKAIRDKIKSQLSSHPLPVGSMGSELMQLLNKMDDEGRLTTSEQNTIRRISLQFHPTPSMSIEEAKATVANKYGLGSTLVMGHKASYWEEAMRLYANQFKR